MLSISVLSFLHCVWLSCVCVCSFSVRHMHFLLSKFSSANEKSWRKLAFVEAPSWNLA